jgi:hypothetical protein
MIDCQLLKKDPAPWSYLKQNSVLSQVLVYVEEWRILLSVAKDLNAALEGYNLDS